MGDRRSRRIGLGPTIRAHPGSGRLAVGGSFTGSALAGFLWDDVPQGSFFEDHIYWLTHEQGLANGYPDFTFRPDNSITRAQMAFWLGNYNDRFDLADGITFAAGGEQSLTATASCPPGRRALGGGGKLSSNDLSVTDSFPNGSTTEWTVRVESDDNASISSGVSLTPSALCGPAPVPVTP